LGSRINITSILFTLLKKHGHVTINGIGHFYVENFKQKLDRRANLILPPLKRILFENISNERYDVIKLIEDNEVLTDQQYSFKRKINREFNKFLNFGIFSMDKFGQIESAEDGKLIFQAGRNDELNKSSRYLPPIELYPLDVNQVALSSTLETKETDSRAIIKTKKSNLNQNSLWTINNSLLAIGSMILIALFLWGALYLHNSTDPNKLAESELEANVIDPNETAQTLNVNSKYVSILTPEILKNGCVIIVGTYKNGTNAQSTYSVIESKGYTPYIEDFQEMQRVGVLFDCTSQDLDQYLIRVQNDISVKAWYLRPDYKPQH
jgi:hypothetical protein